MVLDGNLKPENINIWNPVLNSTWFDLVFWHHFCERDTKCSISFYIKELPHFCALCTETFRVPSRQLSHSLGRTLASLPAASVPQRQVPVQPWLLYRAAFKPRQSDLCIIHFNWKPISVCLTSALNLTSLSRVPTACLQATPVWSTWSVRCAEMLITLSATSTTVTSSPSSTCSPTNS